MPRGQSRDRVVATVSRVGHAATWPHAGTRLTVACTAARRRRANFLGGTPRNHTRDGCAPHSESASSADFTRPTFFRVNISATSMDAIRGFPHTPAAKWFSVEYGWTKLSNWKSLSLHKIFALGKCVAIGRQILTSSHERVPSREACRMTAVANQHQAMMNSFCSQPALQMRCISNPGFLMMSFRPCPCEIFPISSYARFILTCEES